MPKSNLIRYIKRPIPLACLVCFLYSLIATIAPPPHGILVRKKTITSLAIISGCDNTRTLCICPRQAVCAQGLEEVILLLISRLSIYTVYPYIIFLFLSKASYLNALLQSKVYSVYFDFSNMHNIHKIGGRIVEIASWIHVSFHLLRWLRRSEIHLLWENTSGLTGLVAILIMPLITWPMSISFIKSRICYEYRKALHYLSWVWGFALIFHAPASSICWIVGCPFLVYCLNYALGLHFGTFLVESTSFRRVGTGTLLSFENPKGFALSGASYIIVMLPWLGKNEWHAFSVFPHQQHENTSSIFISTVGDWSKKLQKSIHRPTSRAAWISGPFLSPMSSAKDYDNIISIASGIGITPALAVLDRFKHTRRLNLIWMCRDAQLIEFFVNTVTFSTKGFIFIFYTGKTLLDLRENVPPNLFLFTDRPNLEYVVLSTIHRIENRDVLPEEIVEEGNKFRKLSKEHRVLALVGKILEDYSMSEFFDTASCNFSNIELSSSNRGLRGRFRGSFVSFKRLINKEENGAVITRESLNDTMAILFGDDKFSNDTVSTMFDMMSGFESIITRVQFFRFMIDNDIKDYDEHSDDMQVQSLSNSRHFLGSRNKMKTFPNFTQKSDIECPKLDPEIMKTWLLQYCGGSKSVKEALRSMKKDYGIDLNVENFDF